MEFDVEAIIARDYTPIYNEETFQLLLARFDVAKAWRLVQSWSKDEREKRLLWVRPGKETLIQIDHSRVDACDITVPVLMATIETTTPLCIDGWHRNEKAYLAGLELIPAFRLTVAETETIRLRRRQRKAKK